MDKVKAVIQNYYKYLIKLNNVIGIGAGYKQRGGVEVDQKTVIVLVSKKVPETHLEEAHIVPKDIEGIPTDVIEVGHLTLHEQVQRERPAQPGVSIGNYRITAGTFGAVVKDNKSKDLYILSNNHVLANATDGKDDKSKLGDAILQPGTYDGGKIPKDVIGYLEKFQPVIKNVTTPDCAIARGAEKIANAMAGIVTSKYHFMVRPLELQGNLIDAALAKPISEDMISSKIHQIGFVKGVKDAEAGLQVQKSGRTSGVTNGKITAINVTLNVDMGSGETAQFTDQFVTSAISQPGDSGSLVLDIDNNAVGLLFAGSDQATVCNRIQNVLDLMDVSLVTD